MVLDRELRKELEQFIKMYLSSDNPDAELARLRQIWKIEKGEFEFMYGNAVGLFTGFAIGMIIQKHHREVATEENHEIFEIVESYAREIRESLNKYKT